MIQIELLHWWHVRTNIANTLLVIRDALLQTFLSSIILRVPEWRSRVSLACTSVAIVHCESLGLWSLMRVARCRESCCPRASERRVLPIVGVWETFSPVFMFMSSRLHGFVFKASHLHIFASSHLLLIFSCHLHIVASSHLNLFSSLHLLIVTPSHFHIFSSFSHLDLFAWPRTLLPSCLRLLFEVAFEGGNRGSANEMARKGTFSYEMRCERQKTEAKLPCQGVPHHPFARFEVREQKKLR